MEPAQLLLSAIGVAFVLVVLWLVLSRLQRRHILPYTRQRSLLTTGELRFYSVLLRVVPPGMAVFVKVRLMDMVTVPDYAWATYGAPGCGMHLDFVLAEAVGVEPRMVIELDDRSHSRPQARERDAFKDTALASAGVPVLRIKVAARYDEANLREQIAAALSKYHQ